MAVFKNHTTEKNQNQPSIKPWVWLLVLQNINESLKQGKRKKFPLWRTYSTTAHSKFLVLGSTMSWQPRTEEWLGWAATANPIFKCTSVCPFNSLGQTCCTQQCKETFNFALFLKNVSTCMQVRRICTTLYSSLQSRLTRFVPAERII